VLLAIAIANILRNISTNCAGLATMCCIQ